MTGCGAATRKPCRDPGIDHGTFCTRPNSNLENSHDPYLFRLLLCRGLSGHRLRRCGELPDLVPKRIDLASIGCPAACHNPTILHYGTVFGLGTKWTGTGRLPAFSDSTISVASSLVKLPVILP